MTTVTAKQLRENLSDIIDRVEDGEEIVVIRRSRPAIRLVPEKAAQSNGQAIARSIERYQAYIQASGLTFKADPDKSIKELYHEALDNDPKYSRYVTRTKSKS